MFQGSGFGSSTSSPFGGSTFGKPATSGFNLTGFGSNPVTSLFGSTSQPSNSIFPGPSNPPLGFGQPQASQSTFGGTGGGSLFANNQQNTSTGPGLFSSNTSLFSQNKSTFGGFGTTPQQSTVLFGQPATQNPSLFSQTQNQPSTGLFGASTSGFGAGTGGTTIKFVPVTGTDTMVKSGVSSTINTRHHCITCMKEYENKSLEELRLEDYAANRKGPQQGAQPGSLFGSTGQQQSLFGTNTSGTSTFGQTGFGTTGNTMFGAPSGGSLFAKPAATAPFGAPAATTTNTFAFNTNSGGNMFGTTQTGSFLSNQNQQGTAFGTQPTGFTPFGSSQPQQGGLFQQNKPTFSLGSSTSQGFNFGSTSTTSSTTGGGFGIKPNTFPNLGTPATSATGFGSSFATNNQPSLFSNNFKGPSTGFNFGNTNTTSTLGGGGSLFSQNQNKAGSLFPGTGSMFNSSGFNTGGSLFNTGSSSSFGTSGFNLGTPSNNTNLLSGFGQNQANVTNNALNQHMLALASMPFGDSPLFKNLLPNTSKTDEVQKMTSPIAQKSLLNGPNFKVSPKSDSKVKIIKPYSNNIKNSLFEGLDDEEDIDNNTSDLNSSIKLRMNSKRLNLKPKSDINRNSFADTSLCEINDNNIISPQGNTFKRLVKKNLLISPTEQEVKKVTQSPQISTPLPGEAPKMNRKHLDLSSASFDTSLEKSPAGIAPSIQNKSTKSKSESKKTETPSRFPNSTHNSREMQDLSSSSSSDSETEEENSHPAGIVLRRSGYYTIPSLSDLAKLTDSQGRCIVDNFTVGRLNYGNIFYPDSFDVANMNLDKIVHIRHKEVVVYPDDEEKPDVGSGLNRRAQVTLDRVWPVDKTTREPISEPSRIAAMNFESKLRSASCKHGTKFVEYRPQTGSWVFRVDHFSKYGLTDSDEDEGVLEAKKIKLPNKDSLKSMTLPQDKIVNHITMEDLNGPLEPLSEKMFLDNADEEMMESLAGPFDYNDVQGILSPTSKLGKQLGTSTHKVQLMKASFFEHPHIHLDEEDVDDESGLLEGLLVSRERGGGDSPYLRASPVPHLMRHISHPSPPISQLSSNIESEDESETDSVVLGPREELYETVLGLGALKLNDVVCGAVHCHSDLGLSSALSFTPSWGPGLRLIHPCNKDFSIDLNHLTRTNSKAFKIALEEHMEVALKQTVFSMDHVIKCDSSQQSLSSHLQVAMRNCDDDSPTLLVHSQAWALCQALWSINNKTKDSDSYECIKARREQVSSWLASVVSAKVKQEVSTHGESPASVFSLMTSHNIIQACKLALTIGDKYLSLIACQAGTGGGVVQGLMRRQLNEWRETKADKEISISRLKVYMLSAGLLQVGHSSKKQVNCCENLDWLRSFALHLWYVTWPTSSVKQSLDLYDSAWNDGTAPPPAPAYDPYSSHRSVLYHLLKLFADKSHPLDDLLNPNTHTDDPLDYSLSWMLLRVLTSIGYSHISSYNSCLIHNGFASQLEALGLWHWAVFVLLHIQSPQRDQMICELIERNIIHEVNDTKEKFLKEKLHIPIKWIAQAKALKALANKSFVEAADNFIQAEDWNQAHEVIMTHIAAKAIINEHYDELERLVKAVESSKRTDEIWNWERGGGLLGPYLDAIRSLDKLRTNPSIEILHSLSLLANHLASQLNLLPTPTSLDKLCQYEMAERVSRMAVGSDCVGVLSQLPLPPDFSQQHWRSAADQDWAPWKL